MSAFQVCARCATRWPVGSRPAMWCPRCHGVLLSPVSEQAPVQGQRNFKWVARKPRSKRAGSPPHVRRRTTTPRYDEIPRWGLIDHPVAHPDDRESRLERWAGAAAGLLMLAGSLLLLSALAELIRYGILVYNRRRLVDPTTLILSDAFVLFAEVSAIVIGIAAAVASACWLVSRRRARFERDGTRDPRSTRVLLLGSLVPVVSLVMPGVFLTELVAGRHGLLVWVRVWWGLWVANWALIVGASLWRTSDSLQAQADGVLFFAFVALVGAALAFLTVHLVRSVDRLRWRGAAKAAPTRWVMSAARQTESEEKAVAS